MNIGSDQERFKQIIRGKVKSSIGKFIASDDLVTQNSSGKIIKIPLKYIDLPRFTFGSKNQGGTGMGSGDDGDPIDGSGQKGKKSGDKAGEDKGEHDFSAEFTPDELAQLLAEELNLPKLDPKGKGKVSSEKSKYNKIAQNGNEGLKHFKRTFKEGLKREIASGNYNPMNPRIVPIKADKRYKTSSTQPSPEVNAVVFSIIDISGSMQEEQKHLVKSISFWIDLLLKNAYKEIENVFIIHDTEAEEVDRDKFFTASTGGGTKISSAYQLCYDLIQSDYPYSEWNNYIFSFSDGDNFGDDNDICLNLLKDNILPNCNLFGYGQVASSGGSGEFGKFLANSISDEKLFLCEINDSNDIMTAIKLFFGAGK